MLRSTIIAKKFSFLVLILISFGSILYSQTTKIWINARIPTGHCVVSIGDSVFYAFGNYNRHGIGMAFPGTGVTKRYYGSFPDQIKFKSYSINNRRDQQTFDFCDSFMNNDNKYHLFKNNCTTFACRASGIHNVIIPRKLGRELGGKYIIGPKKVIGWTTMTILGSLWAGREALYKDPHSLERFFKNPNPTSWIGSEQWKRKYDKGGKLKTQIFGNFGVDYWHTSKYIILVGGSIFIMDRCLSKQKEKHKILDVIIGSVIFSIADNLTYKLLTHE